MVIIPQARHGRGKNHFAKVGFFDKNESDSVDYAEHFSPNSEEIVGATRFYIKFVAAGRELEGGKDIYEQGMQGYGDGRGCAQEAARIAAMAKVKLGCARA